MKTLDEIKVEIDQKLLKLFNNGFICGEIGKGDDEEMVSGVADSILSIVISKGEECPECKDTKMFGGHYYTDTCPKCNGTGTVDITVGDAIKRVTG